MFTGDKLLCRRGGRVVFAGLSFAAEPGRALAVRGANGSGKSSLLRIAATLTAPAAGALAWRGVPLEAERHRARLAYVGHGDAVKPVLTVRENLRFWASLAAPGDDREHRVGAALAGFGLDRLAELRAHLLSAGERRRLALARLLVADRPLWLLDEPTVSLDDDGVACLQRVIARHRENGGMVMAATHIELGVEQVDVLELAR